ncbi:Na/Pi cotransporter family protein [Hydrogenophaga sp.]|uniref:Na/Pi cotransporter family protein n=1 Tax=Hydrogenophaga sp. TaxID=1904254 RepID=UPI003F70BEED
MHDIVFPFAGGLGLFLIGMMLLSQGLVAFGGSTMKQALAHFTGTPTKAFVSGTLATMALQSSTATTVTLIGFVSAGLISFSQAIGVLIGASLGNTATGWIVATLGLKVSLGFYTLPLIGIGALLKLLARGRVTELGMAMAGFGLMFLGLDTLQQGMRGLAQVFDLAALPSGGFWAPVLTMLIGLVLTAVLQSSTAAIATTLTALHTQAINFDQAAAVVVGAAIGTTLTGALVTVGGTIHAKRTALAYILFNAVVGAIAIALLPVFLWAIAWLGSHAGLDAGATSLAAFHTLFIAVGVLLFLPFVPRFARLVERFLPDRGEATTQRLDASLLSLPAVALEASQRALEVASLGLLDVYGEMLSGTATTTHEARLQQAAPSLNEIYDFVSRIESPADDTVAAAQRIAQLHAIDHLLRFRSRLQELTQARVDLTEPGYHWAMQNSRQILNLARSGLERQDVQSSMESLVLNAMALSKLSREVRHDVLKAAVSGPDSEAHIALQRTDSFRWLERTANHIWRICHYLSQGRSSEGSQREVQETAPPPGGL